MSKSGAYRPLSDKQIAALWQQGCTAEDWSQVQVTNDFVADRVRNVRFSGHVRLADYSGHLFADHGLSKPAGLYNAFIADCTVAAQTRIANVGVHLSNYHIGQGVCIEDIGVLESRPTATFGNGVRVAAVNEGGGREITLFNDLSAQFAFLQCLVRYRPELASRLQAIADAAARRVQRGHGMIGDGAVIRSVKQIVDVDVGAGARIVGASSLVNGTVLCSGEARTRIGIDVQAEDFIVAEGSVVEGGALLRRAFVGQSCRIGRQFSAEGSVFFANCEAFHGEACSVFAGPYTVTHHKSSLLIAGLFSFYNAGSGTNQSNHMYKLGPLHEGKLDRGCKTGSFAYLLWPCHVGPFSVVLGKHTRSFDTRDFPFSHLEAQPDGRCEMVPGLYLSTVGTVRDGDKWPSRDRRPANARRDRIDASVFSPFSAGRMLRGYRKLVGLHEQTDRSVKTVLVDGVEVRRILLRPGAKYYRAGLEIYLLGQLFERLEQAPKGSIDDVARGLAESTEAELSEEWLDVAGQLMPQRRFEALCEAIESGRIDTVEALNDQLDQIAAAQGHDAWSWVRWAYDQVFDRPLNELQVDDLRAAAARYSKVCGQFLRLVLADAEKEFAATARVGFGVTATPSEADADFAAIRGVCEQNEFVRQIKQNLESLRQRVERLLAALDALPQEDGEATETERKK